MRKASRTLRRLVLRDNASQHALFHNVMRLHILRFDQSENRTIAPTMTSITPDDSARDKNVALALGTAVFI